MNEANQDRPPRRSTIVTLVLMAMVMPVLVLADRRHRTAPQRRDPEPHQHHRDRRVERHRQRPRDARTQRDERAAREDDHGPVAEAPEGAEARGAGDGAATGDEGADGGDVIRF